MKKTMIMFVTVMLISAASLSAQWANSGTLTINGNMPAITQVQISDNGVTLNLENSATDVNLGSISERSNNFLGYVVTVTSANGGELVGSTHGETFAYSLSIGGTNMDLSAPATVSDTNSTTSATGITKQILLSHGVGTAGATMLAADAYSDTLTFTIAPK